MFRAIKQHVTKNLSWQTKAWHDTTKCIEQKSFTDHKPKRIRRYDGTHVNIASFINKFRLGRKLGMAKQSFVGMFASSMHSPQGIA